MPTPLVGRARETTWLRDELARTATQSRIVFLTGPPGVGKSRLLAEFERVATRSATVLVGRGSALGATIAFGIVGEAIQRGLRDPRAERLAQLVDAGASALASVVPSAEPTSPPDGTNLLSTLEAIVALLDALASERPVVLELDDVHLADPSTWHLLGYLARSPVRTPVLVVAATRPSGFAVPSAEADRASLLKDELAAELVLEPLTLEDVATLADQALGGAAQDDLAAWLFDRTRGNALFTVELLDALRADPSRRVVPVNVKERVRASTLTLPDDARAALEVAAVLGRSFSLRTIEPLLDGDQPAHLDSLIRLRYLVARDEPDGTVFDFAHPLVQEAIAESLGPARRRELHRRFLERSPGAPLAERAYHAARGALPGDEDAIAVVLEAARDAERRSSHTQAIAHLETARDLLDRADVRRAEVLDELAWQAAAAADHETGIAALEELERTLGTSDPVANARMAMRRASFLATGRADLDAAEREARQAVRGLLDAGADDIVGTPAVGASAERRGPAHALGGALNELAWILGERGDLEAQIAMSTTALDLSERHEDEVGALHALGPIAHAGQLLGRVDEALTANDRALAIARRLGDDGQLGWHTGVRAEVLLAAGRLAEAAEVTDAAGAGATSEVLWFAKARLHWHTGRWLDALAACRRVIAMQAHDPSLHTAWTLSLAGLLETLTGDVATGRAFVAHAERLYGGRAFYDFSAWNDWSAGLALWWAGDAEAARRRAARAMHRAEILRSPTTIVRFVADAVEISADAGDGEGAARLVALASDVRSDDPFTRAQVAYASAVVDPSADGFAVAADAATDLPFLRARALEHLAELSSGAARRDALAEVIRAATALPAPALEARASAALRSEGGSGRRALQHVGRLTARERQVALLAQRGATTKGIADRLHLSERTVESHLAHVYAKLGVSGRKELASLDEL